MKSITIRQPFATLIALGEKKLETRSWGTHYRGPIAIHAGMKIDREACEIEPIKSTLEKHGYTVNNLPTGAVIAIANLSESFEIHHDLLGGVYCFHGKSKRFVWCDSMPNEYYFGFYSNGRFAWEMSDVHLLPDPIPAKGQLGFWNWEGHQEQLRGVMSDA